MVEEKEKQIMLERLSLFDYLWETSPTVQKMREEYKMKGRQEGRQEGRLEGMKALQDVLVNLVRTKFPELADYAQQRVRQLGDLDRLNLLTQKMLTAPDVAAARWLLESE